MQSVVESNRIPSESVALNIGGIYVIWNPGLRRTIHQGWTSLLSSEQSERLLTGSASISSEPSLEMPVSISGANGRISPSQDQPDWPRQTGGLNGPRDHTFSRSTLYSDVTFSIARSRQHEISIFPYSAKTSIHV